MKVICISGKARNGKDTTANIMKRELEAKGNSVLITHYADYLKFICSNFFDWDGKKNDEGRTLLQYIGTDVVRNKDENFWVNNLLTILNMFKNEWDYVLIPDCRFPNEITVMKQNYSTITLRVERNISELSQAQNEHLSECALDNYKFDYYINNNGTIGDLVSNVIEIVNKIS